MTIKEPISEAKYAALMVDEGTDVSNASQMLRVIRCVSDEGVKERFWTSEDVTEKACTRPSSSNSSLLGPL